MRKLSETINIFDSFMDYEASADDVNDQLDDVLTKETEFITAYNELLNKDENQTSLKDITELFDSFPELDEDVKLDIIQDLDGTVNDDDDDDDVIENEFKDAYKLLGKNPSVVSLDKLIDEYSDRLDMDTMGDILIDLIENEDSYDSNSTMNEMQYNSRMQPSLDEALEPMSDTFELSNEYNEDNTPLPMEDQYEIGSYLLDNFGYSQEDATNLYTEEDLVNSIFEAGYDITLAQATDLAHKHLYSHPRYDESIKKKIITNLNETTQFINKQ